MPELDKPNSHLTTVKWRFPSVHPGRAQIYADRRPLRRLVDVQPGQSFLGWLLIGLTIWVAAFFRDPVRTTPADPKLIVAPADGLVTMISRVAAPLELAGEGGLAGEFTRVSIFMSVFDVHINRSPIAGTVRRIAYVPGKFLNADLDKASEDNERQHFLVEREDGLKIGFTQIAGLVARRILSFVKEGDRVEAGERDRPDPVRQPGRRLPAGRNRQPGAAWPADHRRRNDPWRNRRRSAARRDQPVSRRARSGAGCHPRLRAQCDHRACALCFGLTGVRFGITGEWEQALACIVGAGVLDGIDGALPACFGRKASSARSWTAFATISPSAPRRR